MHPCIDKELSDFISSEHMKNQPERYGRSFLIAATIANNLDGVRAHRNMTACMAAWDTLLPQVHTHVRAWDRETYVNRALVENYTRLIIMEYLSTVCQDIGLNHRGVGNIEYITHLISVLPVSSVYVEYVNLGNPHLAMDELRDNINNLRNNPQLNDRSLISVSKYNDIINEITKLGKEIVNNRINRLANVSRLYNCNNVKDKVAYITDIHATRDLNAGNDRLARAINISKEWTAFIEYKRKATSKKEPKGRIADAIG